MQRRIDSQRKLKERSECKRVTRRSRSRKKKNRGFWWKVEQILKLKQKQGLVPKKTFR